jgi:AMP nucleosidase
LAQYILLTNFDNYVKKFAEWNNVEVTRKIAPCAVPLQVELLLSILAWVALMQLPLLIALGHKARSRLFLGKCGGLKRKNDLGDFILPIAAIRGEGTSNDYFPG